MDETNEVSTEQSTTVDTIPVAPIAEVTPSPGTPKGSEPAQEPVAVKQPIISDEGKARMEAEAKYLLDHPERKEYMEKLLAEKTHDPVAELDKKWELKYAKQEAVIEHPELKSIINSVAGSTPDEIKANADIMATAMQPAQGQSTAVESTQPQQVETEPVTLPAQTGSTIPAPVPQAPKKMTAKEMIEVVNARYKEQEFLAEEHQSTR